MILSSSKEELLTRGLSNAKARYITLIAQEFAEQPNLIEELREMSSEEVLATLQRFKGIRIWSASVFALFYLHHPDVFARGDVSLKKAIRLPYGKEDLSEQQIEAIFNRGDLIVVQLARSYGNGLMKERLGFRSNQATVTDAIQKL